jgi:4'-phosphopantetheinyl transferase
VPGLRDTAVWAIRLDLGSKAQARFAGQLSPDELARAARYRRPADRERFIAGRAQLREILGHRLDRQAASLQFEYSASGKPSLGAAANAGLLHFNASGSEGLGLVALRVGAEVGVDIERRRVMPDADALAARLLSADEQAAFARLPASERMHRFFDAWVRKEALAKSLGTGLRDGLDRLSIHPWPLEGAFRVDLPRDGQTITQWVAPLALPDAGYTGAIASSHPFGTIEFRCWPLTA